MTPELDLEALREVVDAGMPRWEPPPARVPIDRDGTCDGCGEWNDHLIASYPEPDNDPWLCAGCDADAALIVAAVNALPVLLDATDELRELWNKARDDRDDAIRLMSELMLKTPAVGEDKDGFIIGYVVPTGPLHRIASYLTQHGQSFPQAKNYADVKYSAPSLSLREAHQREVGLLREAGRMHKYASRLEAERDALTAEVARLTAVVQGVRELCDGWNELRKPNGRPMLSTANVVDRLRAVLAGGTDTPNGADTEGDA